ncbi:MAG: hypothetical protein V1909_07020 [Candidatus Micrarchaeota archaeon]
MRAFVFTVDSFIGLMLALFAISAMLYVSGAGAGSVQPYERLYLVADDAMDVLGGVRISEIKANTVPLSEQETSLEAIGRLVSKGDSSGARELSKNILEPLIPAHFSFSLEYEKLGEWVPIYSRNNGQASMIANSMRVVFGKKTESEKAESCGGGVPAEGETFRPLSVRIRVWV